MTPLVTSLTVANIFIKNRKQMVHRSIFKAKEKYLSKKDISMN